MEERKEISSEDASAKVSSSGFDFQEALHPTMSLAEIMKAFNLGDKKKDSN